MYLFYLDTDTCSRSECPSCHGLLLCLAQIYWIGFPTWDSMYTYPRVGNNCLSFNFVANDKDTI